MGYLHLMTSSKPPERKGWFLRWLWEGFCGLIVFNTLLIDLIDSEKNFLPARLTNYRLIDGPNPCHPSMWARRRPNWNQAIAEREVDLAREHNCSGEAAEQAPRAQSRPDPRPPNPTGRSDLIANAYVSGGAICSHAGRHFKAYL